jgi:hypothetical protein
MRKNTNCQPTHTSGFPIDYPDKFPSVYAPLNLQDSKLPVGREFIKTRSTGYCRCSVGVTSTEHLHVQESGGGLS